MARPRAGGRRHPARMGAHDVRLRRADSTTDGARSGTAAHRRARLRLRVLPRRAGSSRADRASDARMSGARNRGPMRLSRLGRGAALARLALRIGGRYLAGSPRLIFASVERRGELRHERVFARWDPLPFAAASIGQVHRAITLDGKAVAVKVQYPGIARTITSDVKNVALLRRVAAAAFKGLDTRSLIDELGERLREEVDYLQEAENQELFARYYEDHPVIHVPHVVTELSTARVLTSELVAGARFDEVLTWNQRERDMAAETINRFVSRSLYRLHAFNGDPHPGNYLF